MNKVKVSDGAEIAYYVDDLIEAWIPESEKETLVLYHGCAENASVFKPMVASLARRYRVVRLDERGMGESKLPPGTYEASTQRFVDDLEGVMDHLGIEKFHLFTESSGGLVAVPFALAHPDRLLSLLLCQTPYRMNPDLKPVYAMGEESITAAVQRYGFREWQRRVPGWRVFNLEKVDGRIVEWLMDFRAQHPDDVAGKRTEWAFTVDLSDRIKDIRVPTLLIYSGGSYQNSTGMVDYVKAQNPAVVTKYIEGDLGQCTHLVMPDEVAQAMLEYMATLRSQGARPAAAVTA
jgi:pimeloyl-ACP methyl ester carboxylesterase